ncbi:MAG: helix-turn-helix domain-containing protein [Acidimicrobiia bacterium]|jgi:transcriptional regulator with XRE-family HTH domain|nr:helix-turn-helix domain-containing protein [Acidimicrobiia bacterium]MDQ3389775.1 helix-turn-helix domain-containing protein [Actinomycetota bacterium]
MGYGGKVTERHRARKLRAEAWTLKDIAAELGVSKSSVSVWVRDVDFVPNPRRRTRPPRPSSLLVRKLAEIDRLDAEGATEIGRMSDREFLIVGAALYAGEGFKRDGQAGMANTDPRLLALFVTWLRRHFEVDEVRLRVRLYLHEGLDLEAAEHFWSELLRIPRSQFRTPYRAVPDSTIRSTRHPLGCPGVTYNCSSTHRRVMGLVRALSSTDALPG